jgi:hypothetical protein
MSEKPSLLRVLLPKDSLQNTQHMPLIIFGERFDNWAEYLLLLQ